MESDTYDYCKQLLCLHIFDVASQSEVTPKKPYHLYYASWLQQSSHGYWCCEDKEHLSPLWVIILP